MEENSVRKDAPQHEQSKKKKFKFPKLSKPVIYTLVVLLLLGGTFVAGMNYGENKQKKHQTKSLADLSKSSPSAALQNRWTSVGTVQEVSDSKIKVKDSRNETKEASITKDTIIVDRKGTKLTAKDIKKDQRVIVSGTKDEKDKNKLTATRIRIQQ